MGIMGRPRKEINHTTLTGWELIDAIIPFASEEYLAFRLSMSIETLNNRIKEEKGMTFLEYKRKKSESVKISVLQKQFQEAMEGNTSLLIWLGKNMANQSDKQEIKQEQIQINIDADDSDL